VETRPADITEDQKRRLLHFDKVSPHTIRHTIDYMNRNRLVRVFTRLGSLRLLPFQERENGADGDDIRQ
jgi:hypothetical protein